MLSFSCLCCKCMSRKILSLTADTKIHVFVEKNVVDKCSKVFTWPFFKAFSKLSSHCLIFMYFSLCSYRSSILGTTH